jgi:hypothetical protein
MHFLLPYVQLNTYAIIVYKFSCTSKSGNGEITEARKYNNIIYEKWRLKLIESVHERDNMKTATSLTSLAPMVFNSSGLEQNLLVNTITKYR